MRNFYKKKIADNFTNIVESIEGQAYCPYSPDHNSTFVMTSDGSYFSGTFIDHPGRDPAIYRLLGSQRPNFVSAYEIDDFVYVFFREVAVEYINCGKRVFSRVARVCKNDQGGDLVLDDNWTTFLKARMNCSIPGEFPFYFDELQSTFLLKSPEETLLYGIFTTPENARSAWERNENKDPIYQCPETQTDSKNKRELDETEITKRTLITLKAQKYQMMDPAVQPEGISPTLVGKNERWTHIVVDYVEGKTGIYKVIFIATARGHIRKLVQLPGTDKPCLIEEIDLVPNGDHKPVQQLQISREKGALYVSILYKVIQIPLHRCNRFTDSDLCLNAMDPYCGWNLNTEQCTTAPEGMPSLYYWQQDMSSCPQVQHPVDGGWSKWSEWLPCQQTGNDPSAGQCLCHTRICDNPRPLYGGNDCVGSNLMVSGQNGHNGQVVLSVVVTMVRRTRQRYCSNPPPKFGGRSCVGSNTDEGYCPGNPSCPEPPVNGNWARWSDWGQCTAECNGGIQTRRRQCNNPPPSQEGLPCTGNKQEWRMCNTQICRGKYLIEVIYLKMKVIYSFYILNYLTNL
ncbi:hypothetical protein KUTeg_015497 [Tegillarca granosa]|uniref:Sema domain-containing protein n=1 Tax=Tegillarca granosa TaxID=220873 RepID=A0ABQ9EQB5_TEGGR|nr:hypothetical protein KUTeg_015497 [Tegillarca granosa]